MFKLVILASLLSPPLPPVADVPYSRAAEIWVDQFCDEAGGDIGWRPEIYPHIDPSTGQCMLKCVNKYCDLPWNDPNGSKCAQFYIVLPGTWDWSPWCGTTSDVPTSTIQISPTQVATVAREKVGGVKHNRRHMEVS